MNIPVKPPADIRLNFGPDHTQNCSSVAVSGPAHSVHSMVALDLLRAAAALIVFFGHARASSFVEFAALPAENKGVLTAALFGITRLGHEAVMVFFVLSGFLVGGQVIRHVRDGRFSIASYAVDRSTRIFLPLIPAIVLTVTISWLVFGSEPNWFQIALNMLGLNQIIVDTLRENAPLWTLSYEIWFYILAGAAGYLLNARRASLFAFLVVACSVPVFSVLSARYLLFWCAGALSVFVLAAPWRRAFAILGGTIFLAGIVGYELSTESKSFADLTYLPQPVAEALICIGVSLAIPFLCSPETNAALSIFRRPALYLSSLSYTLYLVHCPLNGALGLVLSRASNLSWSSIGMFGAKIVLLLLIVQVFYFLFEANTAALRNFLKRWRFAESTDSAPMTPVWKPMGVIGSPCSKTNT